MSGLFLLGASAHCFGFGLNDLLDFQLDQQVPVRQKSPLISGKISPQTAWIFVILQIPFSVMLWTILLDDTPLGLLILFLSMVFSIIYNRWSKWGILPRLIAEVSLASSIALLCLGGAMQQTSTIQPATLLFCLTLFLILLLLNSVPSGLKDLKTDADFGAKSFVLEQGCFVDHDNHVTISRFIKRYSYSLQSLVIICTILLATQFSVSLWQSIFSVFLVGYAFLHLRYLLSVQSFSQIRTSMPLFSGFCNYFMLLTILAGQFPLWIIILYWIVIGVVLTLPLRKVIALQNKRPQIFIE